MIESRHKSKDSKIFPVEITVNYLEFEGKEYNCAIVKLLPFLKNALIPVLTITGLQLGSIIAFALITEQVFQWPGMGLLFLESIRFVDIPVMGVYLVVIAFFFVIVNLIVDLLYAAGLRRQEAADLTWDRVHYREHLFRLQ